MKKSPNLFDYVSIHVLLVSTLLFIFFLPVLLKSFGYSRDGKMIDGIFELVLIFVLSLVFYCMILAFVVFLFRFINKILER